MALHVDLGRHIERLFAFCPTSFHWVPLYSDPRLIFDPVRPLGCRLNQTYVVLKLVCCIVRLSTHRCMFRYDEERFGLA